MRSAGRIEQILTKRFQRGDLDYLWHVTGPVVTQNFGAIFRGYSPEGGPEVAIKFFANEEAPIQYAALKYAWERLGSDDGLTVPRPFALIEDENLVLMEWLHASTLTTSILKASPSSACSYLRMAGQWLRRFHEMERLPESTLDTNRLIEALINDISSAGLDSDYCLDSGYRVLESTAKEVGQERVQQGVLHGDFKPDNLFVSGAEAKGIDFSARFRSTVTADLAHFINHLMLLTWEPASIWHRLTLLRRNLRNEFLSGYEAGRAKIPTCPLLWMRLHNYLRIYIVQRSRPLSLGVFYLQVCLRQEIKWVSSSLMKNVGHGV